MKWPQHIAELRDGGEPFVIVTVGTTRGSTPRETGAKMFVTPTRTLGTIGGGQLEYECTSLAALWFRAQTEPETYSRSFTLGANCGQCCGGVVEIWFEQIVPAAADWIEDVDDALAGDIPAMLVTAGDTRTGLTKRVLLRGDEVSDPIAEQAVAALESMSAPQQILVTMSGGQVPALFEPLQHNHFEIVLFGAGHVGSALVASLSVLNCRVVWIDGRDDIFPEVLPANTHAIGTAEPQLLIGDMAPGSYYVVMTHSHALDLEVCARILARDDFAYCGLIGSRSKRRQFEKRLAGSGLSEQQISRLVCPVGISGINGKRPAEIAVAVTAQLLQLREAELALKSESPTCRLSHAKI
ncbi:MAG: xanthine dehydrogenase accessory protein XdhC [Gammaproteobacteria bacterium]|nr:xanthine dehydrogenase accessory protein XdhC [Gammaproteobacteria bacterium]